LSRAPAPPLPSRGESKKKRPAARRARGEILIDVIVRSARWKAAPKAVATIRKAISAAANAVSTPPAGLAIVLCDDSAIRALNRQWRGQNAPTNVLSFPAAVPPGRGRKTDGGRRPASPYLGDIAIAYETVARESVAEGRSFPHHLAHLAVHGFLHLIGHDHDNDHDAQAMERLERRILAGLGIPDPYAD
jgi:probable rRNA maturation factor